MPAGSAWATLDGEFDHADTMTADTTARRVGGATRKDLADGHLRQLIVGALVLLVAFLFLTPLLPPDLQRPGSPLMQSLAIVGALLLLTPIAYVLAKRAGMSDVPNRWFIAHVVAALAGLILVVFHSGGALFKWPSLLLYALAGLVASGTYARLRIAHDMASTLGRKQAGFAVPDPALQKQLRQVIGEKSEILAQLEPEAREGTFSVTLRHCIRSPRLALRYASLARREAILIGTRGSVGFVQAWWRPLHLALAALFLAGLFVHVVTVTFFAGYVAGGRTIYWWHLARW